MLVDEEKKFSGYMEIFIFYFILFSREIEREGEERKYQDGDIKICRDGEAFKLIRSTSQWTFEWKRFYSRFLFLFLIKCA